MVGKYIVLEGGEGSGKSTMIKLLEPVLKKKVMRLRKVKNRMEK